MGRQLGGSVDCCVMVGLLCIRGVKGPRRIAVIKEESISFLGCLERDRLGRQSRRCDTTRQQEGPKGEIVKGRSRGMYLTKNQGDSEFSRKAGGKPKKEWVEREKRERGCRPRNSQRHTKSQP